jgi:hypothetical protein
MKKIFFLPYLMCLLFSQERESRFQTVPDTVEYELVPNWSLNLYGGYPILKGSSFDYYDEINPVFGLSVGSPYGLFIGNFFINAIAELAYYKFDKTNDQGSDPFSGIAYQIGIGPGFFIGEASVSATACTGYYHAGPGFIAGGSIDYPLDEFIEIRLTGRGNLVRKTGGDATWWAGVGISLGYEF